MQKANSSGYSLLEVMIVLLIMSILLMVAVPFYQNYLVRSRRTEAQHVLMSSALALEHYYHTKGSYEGASLEKLHVDLQNVSPYYDILVTYESPNSYVLSAIPTTNQEDRACGTITLDQLGRRGYSGMAESLSDCW